MKQEQPLKAEGKDEWMQIRFHTIYGKGEVETVCDTVAICQKFFATPSPAPSEDVEELCDRLYPDIKNNKDFSDYGQYLQAYYKRVSERNAFKAGYAASKATVVDKSFYCWHNDATKEDKCEKQCEPCSKAKRLNTRATVSNGDEKETVTVEFIIKKLEEEKVTLKNQFNGLYYSQEQGMNLMEQQDIDNAVSLIKKYIK